jgi:hypothetical protein
MQPLFYDEFNIDEQFQKMKKLVAVLEKDVYKFISPTKNKQAAVRARKRLGEIKELSTSLRKSISKQRNHNDSEY